MPMLLDSNDKYPEKQAQSPQTPQIGGRLPKYFAIRHQLGSNIRSAEIAIRTNPSSNPHL